jgi:hypothetical protein
MRVKIDYEKLKKAMDMLYEAIDYSGEHYAEFDTECYVNTTIKGVKGQIEVPVEYLPMLALKALMEFERIKMVAEAVLKRFKEGVWE